MKEALKLALDFIENSEGGTADLQAQIKAALAQSEQKRPQNCGTGYCSCIECVMEAEQEPAVLKWQQAPIRTAWGDDMVVASIAIDNDHTLSLYCERDQTPKVDVMFAQRTWVGLTDEEIKEIVGPWGDTPIKGYTRQLFDQIEAKLREKNQ
jgi:hypothetical protein